MALEMFMYVFILWVNSGETLIYPEFGVHFGVELWVVRTGLWSSVVSCRTPGLHRTVGENIYVK